MSTSDLSIGNEEVLMMECPPFQVKAFCSDNDCPCSNTTMPPANGYLWIKPEVAETRKSCLSLFSMQSHMASTKTSSTDIDALRKNYVPLVVCEEAAKRRNLDLDIAASDYTMWVNRGKVLCRPTPLLSNNTLITDIKKDQQINSGESEYVCSECGADVLETDIRCPKCGVDISTIDDNNTLNEQTENNNVVESNVDNGSKDMIFGALWCIGGIVVTLATYSKAVSSPTGGHYFIAWGAVIFGGWQFIKGFFRYITHK